MTSEEIKKLPAGTMLLIVKSDGSKIRAMYEGNDTVFEYARCARRYGYRHNAAWIDTLDGSVRLAKDTAHDEKLWKLHIQRVIDALTESGLWGNYLSMFKNLAAMDYAERDLIRELYDSEEVSRLRTSGICKMQSVEEYNRQFREYYKEYLQKYPFLFHTDERGYAYVETWYLYGMSDGKLKSMYFGKYINQSTKEHIASCLQNKYRCTIRERTSYDVTFEYDPEKNKAWYSEEYRDTGNGHYYIALNSQIALYSEDD